VAGLAGAAEYLAYGATKAAVISMTRTMAQQHGPDGVRVNCVAPGLVYTPMSESMYTDGMTAEQREGRRMRSLLQVEGTAWDVARAALFLAGDDAGWITGQVLPVDGGLTAGEALAPRRGPGTRP
jgi:NAD(P)-dependent dehydrogenase (short-subunit alcohol dehydrogenase family)